MKEYHGRQSHPQREPSRLKELSTCGMRHEPLPSLRSSSRFPWLDRKVLLTRRHRCLASFLPRRELRRLEAASQRGIHAKFPSDLSPTRFPSLGRTVPQWRDIVRWFVPPQREPCRRKEAWP